MGLWMCSLAIPMHPLCSFILRTTLQPNAAFAGGLDGTPAHGSQGPKSTMRNFKAPSCRAICGGCGAAGCTKLALPWGVGHEAPFLTAAADLFLCGAEPLANVGAANRHAVDLYYLPVLYMCPLAVPHPRQAQGLPIARLTASHRRLSHCSNPCAERGRPPRRALPERTAVRHSTLPLGALAIAAAQQQSV